MSTFEEMARQARENPEIADFVALRQAYLSSDNYRPTSHFSANKLMGNTNGLASFDEVVDFCETVLDSNVMDLEVWMLLSFAAEKTDQGDVVERADAFIKGMLNALFSSGDGLSTETAYQVMAVAEEYTALSVQGLKSRGQELLHQDDRYFDVLTCKPRQSDTDELVKIYFDITAPFLYLQNMFE